MTETSLISSGSATSTTNRQGSPIAKAAEAGHPLETATLAVTEAGTDVRREIKPPKLVEALVDFQKAIDRHLEIRVDDDSGRTVVSVIDSQTRDVIRQIPAEEVLRTIEALEGSRSLLLDTRI